MLLLDEAGGSARSDLDAPAGDVFALITDTSRLPEWNARIGRVLEPPRRSLAPGVEWVVQMQVFRARWPSRSTTVTCDAGRRQFEYTSRSDDGNPSFAQWRWQVTPLPGQRSRIEVTWRLAPRTFWRRALFARIRRRQFAGEVPASLYALARLLAGQPAAAQPRQCDIVVVRTQCQELKGFAGWVMDCAVPARLREM
jgi:uncharacterized protein YndB with AHSA1/START domain